MTTMTTTPSATTPTDDIYVYVSFDKRGYER